MTADDDSVREGPAPEQLDELLPVAAEHADELPAPASLSAPEQQALLAALLFAAGEVLPLNRLAEFFGRDEAACAQLLEDTAGSLRALGLDLLRAAGGYRMVTAGRWDAYLARFHRQVRRAKLGRSALEILAVIAYEQPISRARIDELRQVNSESTLRSLLDKRLISVAGRADAPGRPFLYKTTDKFLEVFALASLDDLPPRPASLDLAPPPDETESQPPDSLGLDDLPGFDDELED